MNTQIFLDLQATPPQWLVPLKYDAIRVTTRGTDPAKEEIAMTFLRDGLIMMLR